MSEQANDPAWSPDGKNIICDIFAAISGPAAIDVATGDRNLFMTTDPTICGYSCWMARPAGNSPASNLNAIGKPTWC